MYRSTVLIFRDFNRNILDILLENNVNVKKPIKYYHSENVFGYNTKIENKYKVPQEFVQNRIKESNFYRLVTAFREHAHKIATINPIIPNQNSVADELDLSKFGLNNSDIVSFKGILNITGKEQGSISEALTFLNDVYAKFIGVEFMHTETEEEREWFSNRLESLTLEPLDNETRIQLALKLLLSQTFDKFLTNKFPNLNQHGGEGAESMLAFFLELFKLSANDNLKEIVLAMSHRGRLNLLTGVLKFPPAKLFRILQGFPDFSEDFRATGDVFTHIISSVDLKPSDTFSTSDNILHISMLNNPSHLEAVNPVSLGKTRAKQLALQDGDYSRTPMRWSTKVLNVQIHGDGAFPGQGVNAECLAMCQVPHFEIGGSLHLVVNNQVAISTPGDRGRSSRYCTDLAKMNSAPVIHVNGDEPEMVVKTTKLAFEYQRKFRKDVFLDLNCYRQWGHNDFEDPTFFNPVLYSFIKNRKTVPDKYAEKLIKEGLLNLNQIHEITQKYTDWLNEELKSADTYIPDDPYFKRQWTGYRQATNKLTECNTGVDKKLLTLIGETSVTYPQHFNIHSNLLKTHIQTRLEMIKKGIKIDWATAEAMALGSLLIDGYNVRISGQDVGRGTFSQRHAMLVDQKTNKTYIPLNYINIDQKAYLEVANSILSEEAALGFEYGISIESPKNLIIWEVQFGDFFNGAQLILDTFITSGETKWLQCSGLTILLPHGYDGAGPEHSSCRLERHLQMTDSKENEIDGDSVNIQIAQPSTPAQYFHLLRRQMIRDFRKPLIIVSPKTLLRLPEAVSSFNEMIPETYFLSVIGDDKVDPLEVQKVILTSGKHYYNLENKRRNLGVTDTAISRLEIFCPFPALNILKEINKYPNAKSIIWCQEEPRNMGAWSFIKPRFENLIGRQIQYIGRETSAAPDVGIKNWYKEDAKDVIINAFI